MDEIDAAIQVFVKFIAEIKKCFIWPYFFDWHDILATVAVFVSTEN